MDIRCGRCRRSYFVPDDLVHGRTFRARCSHCGDAFSVEVPESRRRPRRAPSEVPSSAASALPDLLDGMEDQLGWLDEAAREADEQEIVLLTVQRSRRSSAALMLGAVALLLAAAGGVGAWIALRPRPEAAAPRERAAPTAGGPVVADVGGLAYREAPPDAAPIASATAPAPVARPPVQRARSPRLARSDQRLLDLLARKDDVAVVAVDADEGAGAGASARSALAPAVAAKVLAGNRKAFDACISRALRQRPDLKLARRATLVVTVQPSGVVERAYLAEEEVDRTDLGACIVDAARRMVFPSFDGEPVDVAMPLSLSAVF